MDAHLDEMASLLRGQFRNHLERIIFFGSRARGDASPESDFDSLLVFDEVTPVIKEQLNQLSSKWLLEKGIVFAWVALSAADLKRLRYEPFLQNAQREGVAA